MEEIPTLLQEVATLVALVTQELETPEERVIPSGNHNCSANTVLL